MGVNMIGAGLEEKQNQFFDDFFKKIEPLQGIDILYFLNKDFQVIREKNKFSKNLFLNQVSSLIKTNLFSNNFSGDLYSKPFHTCTLLNENGLIVLSNIKDLYLVIIGGENEPVDLINLLKIVRESYENYKNIVV